jgi:putative acetyltransferase
MTHVNRDLVLRRERPNDVEPTRALHDLAFGVPDGADHSTETRILDQLRADGDVLDALTLVADLHGEVVGHVVCSRASMGEGVSIALGPIAVHPDHQGQGIGSALVAAVLVTADLGGEPSVVLLGDPGWYGHFGFEPAADHGIGSPGSWADRLFQVKPLQAWHPELAGAFRYAPAFDLDGS